ncbi:ras-related protein Rab-24-like [Oratosquilla oratoria]|uniref:ras-related protein Rab-24-like n=1 Tax=Oratosquilla oratoria TaxID=337810 RepID=UPI003F774221
MSYSELKIVVLGQMGCGKSCLVERFISGTFSPEYKETIGALCAVKKVVVKKREVQFNILDTAGGERYETMTRVYYKNAIAAIVCYDMNDSKSLKRTWFWVNELLSNVEGCQIYLCGTKLDQVVKEESSLVDSGHINEYATWFNGKIFETSAKTGENIEELFKTIFNDFAKANPTIGTMVDSFSPLDCFRKTLFCC